ncbi:MAG: ABC transporter substrate-binding protein [Curvibacter sp.]|jgi:iron complex transport system substrate-binding protein|nr:ABC transporter substrate-binding protein [Curvibacter sp.]
MRERLRRLLVACALLSLAACLPAVQITDDRGVLVSLPRAPQRIVSLFPSLTETVCQLGACARLVGVDRHSNHPAEVQTLPRVGGGLDPSIEAIVALRPELVLMATSARGAERLEALGIRVAALQPGSHADVRRMIERIGVLLDAPAPGVQAVWTGIEAELDQAARSVPPRARGLRVYFEINSAPYAAGEASFIGETLARLGARNIVPASLGPYPRLNPEFVVRADPDLILVGDGPLAELRQRPGWAGLRALREQRVCALTAAQSDIVVRSGPRLAEGARILAHCLRETGVPR